MKTRLLNLGALLLLVTMLVPAVPAVAADLPASSIPAATDVQVTPDSGGVTVELTLPSYNVQDVERDGATYQQIAVDGDRWAQAGAPGAPQLPERGLLLAVPPKGEVTLQVLEAEQQTVPGSFRLQPAPTAQLVENAAGDATSLETRWTADAHAYSQNAWQPAAPAEITQEGWMRGYRFVRLALRPFQANPASGALRATPTLRVRVSFDEPVAAEAVSPAPDPIYEPIFQATFANFDQAAAWQTRPEPIAAPASAVERSETTGSWVKLTVNVDGVYRVTYNNLLSAGVPAATLNTLVPLTLRVLDAGQEQAVYVFGEADGHFDATDYVLFYGRRNTAPLSNDDNVYWLTWGGANGLRMTAQDGTPGIASYATTLLTTVHAEQNVEYRQQRPWPDWLQPITWDNWYWEHVVTSKTITLQDLKVPSPVTIAPVLEVWMAGDNEAAANYQVALKLNGQTASSISWTNTKVLAGTQTLPAAALVNGANNLWLSPVTGLGNPFPTVWLDWINLTYQYSGEYISGATFNNPNAGTWRYRITSSPGASPWILDVGTPAQPKRVTGATSTATGNTYTVIWQATTTASNRFLVVPEAEVRQPTVQVYVDAGLLQTQQVDYLMIAHASLMASVQPLVTMHQAEGLTVRLINVQDIYDAFSDGSVSAGAIRDYLAYAYSHYTAPVPSFALLIGDGTVDFRNYKFSQFGHPNLMPPYVGSFDAWGGVSISDNAYVWLQGSDLLGEMIVSRLPVNTTTEAQVVVSKITNYSATFPVNRALNTLWITDNPDNDLPQYGTQFYMASEQTIQQLDPNFAVSRVYYCDPLVNSCPAGDPSYYTDPALARAAVISNISQGQVLVHYAGHGTYTRWAYENLFRNTSVSQLSNGAALPFLLVSSCDNGYFASPQYDAIDEVMLRTENKGTIGGFTGVTFDTLNPQSVLLGNFVEAVMHDRLTQPGVAVAVARARSFVELATPENERMAVGHGMSGDPALYLVQPQRCARGDLDCDGDIDIADVQLVAAVWNTVAWMPGYNPRADLARSGRIDVNDIIQAAGLWHTLP